MATEVETPPRAWGRHPRVLKLESHYRNTPTSVGKTLPQYDRSRPFRKHPHERGEDNFRHRQTSTGRETPPRAWGRLRSLQNSSRRWRNTPTSVGKTHTADR